MIYLTRHGNRHDNHDKNWAKNCPFHWDTPICPTHYPYLHEQAKTLINKISIIYSSPFIRAVQTAWIYADTCNVPICIEGSLSECLKGVWFPVLNDFKLVSPQDLSRHYPQIDIQYVQQANPMPPEGRKNCRRRVNKFLDWLIPQNTNCLLVGHGFSIKDCKVRFGMDGKIPEKGTLLTPP